MHRSEITVDLGAVRRNARTLLRVLEGSQLWAVVKADAYGHGAVDVAGALVDEGVGALCVATVAEAIELRAELSLARILVMGPTASSREIAEAREAKLELAVWDDHELPEGVRVHLKLDTGMGRWGLSELPKPSAEVVGLMTHLATADSDPAFARTAGRALSRGDRAVLGPDASRGQQRGRAADPVIALRRRPLRGRALRPLALRRGPGGRRARAGALVAELPRAGQAVAARREHGLRAALHGGGAHLDRDRPRRLRGRLSPRPDRHRGARLRRGAARGRDGLDGRLRRRARSRRSRSGPR